MPYNIPTLKDLVNRYEASYIARVPAERQMPVSILKAKSRALAQGQLGLYDYASYILRQIIPTTADCEYLEMHASVVGVYRKATAIAYGKISVKGNIGAVLYEGSVLTRSNGSEYAVKETTDLTETEQEIDVVALKEGISENTSAGTVLSFKEPLAGLENQAIVISIGGGTDIEKDSDLLYRYLLHVREPACGGSDTDYIKWALEVQGVTKCFVFAHEQGTGTVTLRIMTGSGQADEQTIERCFSYIQTKRPITVKRLFVFTPDLQALDVTIANLDQNTQTTKEAIRAELADLIYREATPGGTLLLSHIRNAIASAEGVNDQNLVLPTTNVVTPANKIIVLGEITWL